MTERKIKAILPIPDGLREAASIGGQMIPFMGAGLSKLAGCPNWGEFADKCLEQCAKIGLLNYSEKEQLKRLNPRIKLTLAKQLAEANSHVINYKEILSYNLNSDTLGAKAYSALQKIASIFLTTNYDDCMQYKNAPGIIMRAGDPVGSTPEPNKLTRIFKKQELTPAALNKVDTIIHLHGFQDSEDSMIITTEDYANHYASNSTEKNKLITTLVSLCSISYH